jgi:hypothetical protein
MGRFAVFRVWSALPVLTAGAAWVAPIVAACHGTGEVEAGYPRPLVHHRARQPDPFAQLVIGGPSRAAAGWSSRHEGGEGHSAGVAGRAGT